MIRPPRRRHPVRRTVIALFSLIVLVVVLFVADRVGRSMAENDFATQAEHNGFVVRPSVDITGFPFLTQLAARDFKKVTFSASDVPAGLVKISSVHATATGVHVNSSLSGATVDHISGTGVVTFKAIGSGLSGGTGMVTVSAAGPGEVKVDAGLITENASISTAGNKVSVEVENNGSILGGILNALGSFSFTVPQMPAGMRVSGASVTDQGLVITFSASHTPFTN